MGKPSPSVAHVTLTTGHLRQSPRREVADSIVAELRPLIDAIVAGKTVPIPGLEGYSISGRSSGEDGAGRCLSVIVWAERPEVEPICTIGIAAHSRCGARLWRSLHEVATLPAATDPGRQPAAPWVAAALQAGLDRHLEAASWLGDFERCLAWTWIER
ncbi:hypothetical protein [Adonisia turfae]